MSSLPFITLVFQTLTMSLKKYYPYCHRKLSRSIQRYPISCKRTPKNLHGFLVKAKLKESLPSNANRPKKVTRCNDGCCLTCKFICRFLISSMGYIISQLNPAPFFGTVSVTTLPIFLLFHRISVKYHALLR